jgi:hypothetical protein
MHKGDIRYSSFSCKMGETTFVIGGEQAKLNLHNWMEKEIKRVKADLATDLKQFAHKSYIPKLPGIYGIALGISKFGGEYRKEMRNLYWRMLCQAQAWKNYYFQEIRNTSQPRMILFMTKELQIWQNRWERTRELTICCMSSVTIDQYAPVPSVTSIGSKRRAPSDVEDDL